MDRKGIDSIASLAVDMSTDVFKTISATIAKTSGANREPIMRLVALAFLSVATRALKHLGEKGEPLDGIVKHVRETWEVDDGL